MKGVVFMTRYPYTASIIAVMWVGTAVVSLIRQNIPIEGLLLLLALATLIVAFIGFSPAKR